MKIVVNRCWGGFSLSKTAAEALGLEGYYSDIDRTDERLVAMVENDPEGTSGPCAKLVVREVPGNCTDYEINDYDGMESVICVVDGKLVHL